MYSWGVISVSHLAGVTKSEGVNLSMKKQKVAKARGEKNRSGIDSLFNKLYVLFKNKNCYSLTVMSSVDNSLVWGIAFVCCFTNASSQTVKGCNFTRCNFKHQTAAAILVCAHTPLVLMERQDIGLYLDE